MITVEGGVSLNNVGRVNFLDHWELIGHPYSTTASIQIYGNNFGYARNVYYANGTFDSLSYTTDGGETWVNDELRNCYVVSHVIMRSPTEYIFHGSCNEGTGLYKFNANSGERELKLEIPQSSFDGKELIEVAGITYFRLNLGNDIGKYYTSTDFGNSWTEGPEFTQDLFYLTQVSGPGTIASWDVLEDSEGELYTSLRFSNDNGASFGNSVNVPLEDARDIDCNGQGKCVWMDKGVFGISPVNVYSTTDNGQSWTKLLAVSDSTIDFLNQILVSGNHFIAIKFEMGSILESDSFVYWSTDGGLSWKVALLDPLEQLESIHQSENGNFYMVASYNREEFLGDDQVNIYRLK